MPVEQPVQRERESERESRGNGLTDYKSLPSYLPDTHEFSVKQPLRPLTHGGLVVNIKDSDCPRCVHSGTTGHNRMSLCVVVEPRLTTITVRLTTGPRCVHPGTTGHNRMSLCVVVEPRLTTITVRLTTGSTTSGSSVMWHRMAIAHQFFFFFFRFLSSSQQLCGDPVYRGIYHSVCTHTHGEFKQREKPCSVDAGYFHQIKAFDL